jgi:sodium/proline symporter
VGTWPIAISEAASVASGWTFFAWVGTGFLLGLNGLWFSLSLPLVVLLIYRYVGPRLRPQSEALGTLTIVDHISTYFRDSGRRLGTDGGQPGSIRGSTVEVSIRSVSVVSVVVFMIAYVGSQMIAVGELLDSGLGVDYGLAVVAGGIAVGLYTVLGGFNASVWTDVLQALLLLFALISLPILAVAEIGGWGAFVSEAAAADPTLLSVTGGLTGTELLLGGVVLWVSFALAAIGQPHSLMRLQAIRSERILSAASVIAVSFYAFRMTVPLFIGISGRVLYEGIEDPEAVAVVAIVDLFPAAVAGLLLAGIASAILSTSDSMMIVTASDVTRFYEEHVNPEATQRQLVIGGRLIVAALATLGVVLAFVRPGTIFDIVLFAYVGLGVTFGVPLIGILFWKRTTGWAVFATVVVGLATSIVHAFWVLPELFPVFAWFPPILTLVLVSYVMGPPEATVGTGSVGSD